MDADNDRCPLGAGGWLLWRHVVLRSAGFPFARLTDALGDPVTADPEPTDEAWRDAVARTVTRALPLAADPGIRMALWWQNPAIDEVVVRWLERHADTPAERPQARRRHETTLTKYLQRYHAKNDSVGFFGPVSWATIDHTNDSPPISAVPGGALIRRQLVRFEDWAVHALGEAFAADPEIAWWLPPALRLDVGRVGGYLTRAGERPYRLTGDERRVVDLVDGSRDPDDIARAAGLSPRRTAAVLRDLVDAGLLTWSFDVPLALDAEQALSRQLAALPPGPATRQACEALRRLRAARDDVAASTSPVGLAPALARLDRLFTEVTGAAPTRSRNVAPRGRRLLVSQHERDVRVTLGRPVVDALAEPLALVLAAARWLAWRAAEHFNDLARAGHRALAPLFPDGHVALDVLCQRLIPAVRPEVLADAVAEMQERWGRVLAVDPSASREHRAARDLSATVGELFAAPPAPWHSGRHHSPDVMIAAANPEAVAAGEYELVLGELHVGLVTADDSAFNTFAPDPDLVRRASDAALTASQPRFVPLHPRTGDELSGFNYPPPEAFSPAYHYLSFGERVGERPVPAGRRIKADAVSVHNEGGDLVAVLPDGSRHSLTHVLGEYVSYLVSSQFRLMAPTQHTPRITIDRLVVTRETWRVPVSAFAAATIVAGTDEAGAFRAVRRLATDCGIARHTFWRTTDPMKPIYLDLCSPLLVALLLRVLRGAEGMVTFTEMYPGPDELWLTDADGERYTSELRLTVAEPAR
ncbi:lantibiotic dehydratase [Salinispora pacifica]|uniref:lantibiotic dehydratase n=1 Tax=Salinispora pacifica TaxID=351187 RepID=UPI00036C4669|nr:lantibiotic dehydratase [Salinispora pacifica]